MDIQDLIEEITSELSKEDLAELDIAIKEGRAWIELGIIEDEPTLH